MSKQPVDELLAALPEVGLRLAYLGQHSCGTWGCQVAPEGKTHGTFWGQDDTAAGALIAAIREAGVDVTDDSG